MLTNSRYSMFQSRWTSTCLWLLFAFFTSSWLQPTDDLQDRLAVLERAGDDVDRDLLDELAAIGGEEAFKALQECTSYFESIQVLYRAYGAFAQFKDDLVLAPAAIKFLEREAFKDRRGRAQVAATWCLSYFDGAGDAALERIVVKHKDPTCRDFAVQFLIEKLGERGGAHEAALILRNTRVNSVELGERVFKALWQCDSSKSRKRILAKLLDEDTSQAWSLVLLRLASLDSNTLATRALVRRLEAGGGADSFLIKLMTELGCRRTTNARKAIKPYLESRVDELRCAALLATSRIMGPSYAWLQKLSAYAKGDDPNMRQSAARCLVELRAEDAFEILKGLLNDEDLRARSLAVELLAEMRDPRTVPLFIEHLKNEHGALRMRIARVLRLSTGQDYGFGPGRWNAWWTAEGATFVFPTEAEALALEFDRRKRKGASGRTQSVFYGLPVQSSNVCFILDTSGSMLEIVPDSAENTEAKIEGEDPKGPTRLDVAKRRLAAVLKSLQEKTYCNVIFFAKYAKAWQRTLVPMAADSKLEALEFVESSKAKGSTNVYAGLLKAFDDPRIDTIYLLTDGEPTSGQVKDPTRLRELVSEWNTLRHVQIHCISVGRESDFLRSLAAENGGDFRVVD